MLELSLFWDSGHQLWVSDTLCPLMCKELMLQGGRGHRGILIPEILGICSRIQKFQSLILGFFCVHLKN